MEAAGAGAIVMHSLFEEQISLESHNLDQFLSQGADSHAEFSSYFPDMSGYNMGPDGYLEHLKRVKAAVKIPIIASLNGTSTGGWIEYAQKIVEAGADALELNIYYLPTDPELRSSDVEQKYIDLVKAVKGAVKIPVAVKLGPYFSAMANFARRLDQAGADGLVLFNRFYQPDFDIQNMEVQPRVFLSHPNELLLRLHWTALLFGRIRADLAVTGGVHSAEDVVKAMMAGAKVTMVASILLRNGIQHLDTMFVDLRRWLEDHEYSSIKQMQGAMSHSKSAHPLAFERSNYMKVLSSYTLRGPRV
jgi:dihydroorotate dehydrogenase (fumarate)